MPNQDNDIRYALHVLRCLQEAQCLFPSPRDVTHLDVVEFFTGQLDMSQTLESSIQAVYEFILAHQVAAKYHKQTPRIEFPGLH